MVVYFAYSRRNSHLGRSELNGTGVPAPAEKTS
jgi:hypothetical protein